MSKTKKTTNDEVISVSKIKLDDKNSPRHAVILNPKRVKHVKRRMDGGHVKNKTCADWMLSKPETGDIFLELKGCNVEEAFPQLSAAIDYAIENKLVSGRIAALILCTQHPGMTTQVQRKMEAFVKKYKSPIHTRNRSGEFVFEHVLSFNGPDRL